MSDDEKPEGQKAKAKEEQGLKGEGCDFAFHGLNFSKMKFGQAISVKFTLQIVQRSKNFFSSNLKECFVRRLTAANGFFNVNSWAIGEFGI